MRKIKRGVGRPSVEMQQLFAMQAAQAEVKEIFADTYVAAMRYMASLVNDEKASPNLRFTAAKAVKDQVETWLLEHYESMEDDGEEEDDSKVAKPINI